jgi:hypothetical protein
MDSQLSGNNLELLFIEMEEVYFSIKGIRPLLDMVSQNQLLLL